MLIRRFRVLWNWGFIIFSILLSVEGKSQDYNEDSTLYSFEFNGIPLTEVLDQISTSSGLIFSFNPRKISIEQSVSYEVNEKSLKEVFNELGTLLKLDFLFVEEQVVIRQQKPQKDNTAATYTISGFIKESNTGETLIGTTVMLEERGDGVISNPYGFYSLTLAEGSYTLRYSYIGFRTIRKIINLTENISINIDMEEFTPLLPEIIVESSKIRIPDEIQMSKTNMRPQEIKEMPALLGEPDVIKSLQSIPGIKLHSDGSTFFYVRGGDKDQNLIMLDEAPIYNPSHLLGFFSTIIPDAVKDLKIYKGDIPASQGGRLSSLIDIKTNDGNMKDFQAWGTLGLISSKLAIEGPFKKDASSYFLAGRFSRLKWLARTSNPDIETFNFYDLTGKVNFKINDRNRVFATFYTGEDFYEVESNTGINWNNTNGSVRWNHLFSEKLFMNTTFLASKYDYFLITDITKNEKWNSHIANATFKSDFTYFKKPDNMISFGILIGGNNFNPGNLQSDSLDLTNPPPVVSKKNANEFALYFDQEIRLSKYWGVRYGMRLGSWTNRGEAFEYIFDENGIPVQTIDYTTGESYNNNTYLEPRFNLSYFISDKSSLKFSYNRNVQNIHLISNSISPFTSLEVWMPSSINIKPQNADQITLGYYTLLSNSSISFETEGYYKKMNNQIDYIDHAQMLLNPTIENQLLFGVARAYGVEFLLRKEEGKLTGWFGYTLSRAIRIFEGINNWNPYPAFYDRPHDLSIFLAYKLKPRIGLGLNWKITTGAPFTSPSSFYTYDGQEIPVFNERNNDRFQTYHRMDLSAEFKLNRSEKSFDHSISVSIYNLYGRKNDIFQNFNKSYSKDGDIVIPGNLYKADRIYTHTYLYNVVPSISYNFKFL